MSLREEIIEHLDYDNDNRRWAEAATDSILKIIEKRIDSRISSYEDKDTMYASVLQRIAGLKEVKEMLK